MKHILFILIFLFSVGINLSQDTTSTKQEHILIAIEDSLRGISLFGEDSTWLNLQLQILNEPFKSSNIKYKLVKIGKRDFTEGPHASYPINKKLPVVNYKYGDSAYSVLGQKFYTYIGNSSWGYYPEYHLIRVDKLLTGSDLWYSQKCNKGHNKGTQNACNICYEKNSGESESQILLKIREPNTCEHGWDIRRGQACYQCMHNYKMLYDSSYRANDSLKQLKFQSQIMDCNHGHICCEVSWCDCCPEKNPKISIEPIYKPLEINKNVCKHGFNQNLGKACPQCQHEDRMSKDSTLKPYSEYFPKVNDSINRKIPMDCNHGHLCCQVKCPCCPEGGYIPPKPQPIKRKWWQRKKRK